MLLKLLILHNVPTHLVNNLPNKKPVQHVQSVSLTLDVR